MDNGTSWTQVMSVDTMFTHYAGSAPDTNVTSLAVSSAGIFAGPAGGGVYFSTTDKNWTRVDSGFRNTNINALAANGSYVFAGTKGGVFVS